MLLNLVIPRYMLPHLVVPRYMLPKSLSSDTCCHIHLLTPRYVLSISLSHDACYPISIPPIYAIHFVTHHTCCPIWLPHDICCPNRYLWYMLPNSLPLSTCFHISVPRLNYIVINDGHFEFFSHFLFFVCMYHWCSLIQLWTKRIFVIWYRYSESEKNIILYS